jgi:hypothetical protein
LDSDNLCFGSSTPEFALLYDDCSTDWDNPSLQTIKESSDFFTSGVLKVDKSDVTNEILSQKTITSACVKMKWECQSLG